MEKELVSALRDLVAELRDTNKLLLNIVRIDGAIQTGLCDTGNSETLISKGSDKVVFVLDEDSSPEQ